MRTFAILLCFSIALIVVHGKEGKIWALLVSAANTWDNYDMQAEVYHAYHVLRQGAIPEDQIVVMAYDDIAYNDVNPYKGQVFNSYDLKDVYKDVVIDYKGESVKKNTFLSVLKGDKDAVKNLTGSAGKVIDSGPDDNIFVFISDHGQPGYVSWWDGQDLSAKELNDTLTYLHNNNRYKNLVIYVNTCYSGSLFENILSDNIGVYAMTAANATERGIVTECTSKAFPEFTCLGSIYGINWIYQLQSADRKRTSLDMQFEQVKIATRGFSNPKQYGDLSIAKKMEIEFFGDSALNTKIEKKSRSRRAAEIESGIPKNLQIYHNLKNQLKLLPENSQESQRVADELSRVETLIDHADLFIKDVSRAVYGRFTTNEYLNWAENNFGPIEWSCYEPAVDAVKDHCPRMMRAEEVRYYAGSKFGVLINLCNEVRTDVVLAAVNVAANLNPLCDV